MPIREGRLAEAAHAEARRQHPGGYSKLQLVECSREVFGGFGSGLGLVAAPTTNEEIEHKRNAMHFVEGTYPLDMPDCYVVGISGGCGGDCPILKRGACETQDEMEPALAQIDLNRLSRAWLRDRLQAAMEMR